MIIGHFSVTLEENYVVSLFCHALRVASKPSRIGHAFTDKLSNANHVITVTKDVMVLSWKIGVTKPLVETNWFKVFSKLNG